MGIVTCQLSMTYRNLMWDDIYHESLEKHLQWIFYAVWIWAKIKENECQRNLQFTK